MYHSGTSYVKNCELHEYPCSDMPTLLEGVDEFLPHCYVFLSICTKFYAENVEKNFTSLCEFREHRRSEYPYFTTGVDKFPSSLCTLIDRFS
jgi:hypothetical protein